MSRENFEKWKKFSLLFGIFSVWGGGGIKKTNSSLIKFLPPPPTPKITYGLQKQKKQKFRGGHCFSAGLQSTPPGTEPNSRVLFDARCPAKKLQSHQLWTPDIGHWTPDIEHRTLDTGNWTLYIGPDTTSGIRKLDHKLRKSKVTRKQEQQMVLKYRYCPVSDVQCPMSSPVSDVRCPATWVTEQRGGGLCNPVFLPFAQN